MPDIPTERQTEGLTSEDPPQCPTGHNVGPLGPLPIAQKADEKRYDKEETFDKADGRKKGGGESDWRHKSKVGANVTVKLQYHMQGTVLTKPSIHEVTSPTGQRCVRAVSQQVLIM